MLLDAIVVKVNTHTILRCVYAVVLTLGVIGSLLYFLFYSHTVLVENFIYMTFRK